nr:poly(ADP-ribose) glycohydrolase ARH3-like [Leptinotarsa decemlineata]
MSSIIKTIKMATLESSVLQSKFRGSLLGSLIGDCTGSPYEGDTFTNGDKIILQRYFDKLEEPNFKAPFKPYTDDTAMMKSVAKFLIDKPEPDYKFLAKLFVNEYFKQPKRGYGENVVDVFHKLRNSKFEDVFKPAREQFLGSGSYGNGGAMRIAPIALYCHSNYKTMLEIAANATKLTHTNILGVNGALLQCIAIHQALEHHPEEKIDPKRFCLELYLKMKKIEKTDEEDVEDADPALTAYQEKLKVVEHLLGKRIDTDLDEEVIFCLGNGISSYESVPTAIYCFLRAQSEIPHIKTDNVFRRTIQYAISLGGDTDTIACMAGAIAGAHLGEEAINADLARHCEFSKEIIEVADNLFMTRAVSPTTS